ncbi:interleukin-2 receptor subunit beta isoform X2 [Eleginops maclovinus]
MAYIRVECNGTLMENITNYSPSGHIKMHHPGAPNVSSTANETSISWRPGSPPSTFLKSFNFEIQIKQKHKTWNEAIILFTTVREERIPAGKLKGHCEVRVRVKPVWSNKPVGYKSHWSNWSPTTSWMVATNVVETSENEARLLNQTKLIMRGLILGFFLGLIILAMVVYRSCASRGLLKGKPVPNPSKYFHSLQSVHGGNLKNWLNPPSVSESFFTAQPLDPISPLEVCESWDVVASTSPSCSSTSALLHCSSHPLAGSGSCGVVDKSSSSSSSSFSNMGYFVSSSSGSSSVRTAPNPAYFTYTEDFHNRLHLTLFPAPETSPNYESLKEEPQSPDSGFSFGKEDEDSTEDQEFVEEDELFDYPPPLLTLPLHLPLWMCPNFAATTQPSPTPISPENQQQVDEPAAGDDGSWPTAGAMSRSSSMPVEPCRTGYMTLKELQTTFSNKSI